MSQEELNQVKMEAYEELIDSRNESTTIFPIHRLNQRVTEKLSKIISADIPGNINKGLSNEIRLIDDGTNMTDLATIFKLPHTGETYVRISAAFMQYVWVLNDIAIKSIDFSTKIETCREFWVESLEYQQITADLAKVPVEELKKQLPFLKDFDENHCIDYLKQNLTLPNLTEYEEQNTNDTLLLRRLCKKGEKFTETDFANVNLDGNYEELVNGVYCYSIAFAILHELAHFTLGHLEKENEMVEDERNADLYAFWSVFCDIDKKERFMAIAGILCLLFALLMLNPTMEEDNVHPREDRRIFEIYDNVKDENLKYTILLVGLFRIWACFNDVNGFPQVADDSSNSLQQIRNFLASW